ncbi:MAG: hypothetical protein HFG47_04390, partial [Lachnospiraceae bacterium]|nr:hypothetical protein [Lachnospiraceae bacterium]
EAAPAAVAEALPAAEAAAVPAAEAAEFLAAALHLAHPQAHPRAQYLGIAKKAR